jgi:superfamily II DNA or RNA helicase
LKLSLKDYQEEAVAKVTAGLRRASRDYEEGQEYGSVSLSAPTGSGKTVIAAAVIEQIIFGDSEEAKRLTRMLSFFG